ncbi:MAG: PEP-CTERM sorting domain-containing protein [Candidatus Nealsonbacteria bacterium]|nr:PEP-CTERM sorting domain-containing protein [Candidatus Nealsonbacteria bacterium]
MQKDLDANHPELDIRIFGVNQRGYESQNSLATAGRDIPWLQDVDLNLDGQSDAWTSWNVTYRDVVILDAENQKLGAFNLTSHDLQYPGNYNELRQTLIAAAAVPEPAGVTLLATGAVGLLICLRRRNKNR